jgi:hypothetical protein
VKAEEFYADVLPLVREPREDRLSLAEIAEEIHGCGVSASQWQAVERVARCPACLKRANVASNGISA